MSLVDQHYEIRNTITYAIIIVFNTGVVRAMVFVFQAANFVLVVAIPTPYRKMFETNFHNDSA
jgi:hypothetical protein